MFTRREEVGVAIGVLELVLPVILHVVEIRDAAVVAPAFAGGTAWSESQGHGVAGRGMGESWIRHA